VFPVMYELGSYIPEDGILHSHRRANLKSCMIWSVSSPEVQPPLVLVASRLAAQ
jgi:hypothetical protein